MSFFRSRKAAVDLAIVALVGLFFVAGVFFESKRSGGQLPSISRDVDAAAVGTSTPGTNDNSDSSAAAGATSTPSVEPTSIPVLQGTPNPEAVGQRVFLDLNGIENESVVEASEVTIFGSTTPDALLSVNGQSVPVELDGSFTIDLELEPGPNFVEFVSSNLRGEEANRVISVVSIQ